MNEINNNTDFKNTIKALECTQQRKLAALFAARVMPLSKDPRIARVLAVATQENISREEMEAANKLAKAAIVDLHCRCGADCNWHDQAAYFVARAAAASVSPENKCMTDSAAWQAAVNARMARTSASIEDSSINPEEEMLAQFQILNEFLTQRQTHE